METADCRLRAHHELKLQQRAVHVVCKHSAEQVALWSALEQVPLDRAHVKEMQHVHALVAHGKSQAAEAARNHLWACFGDSDEELSLAGE